MTQLLSVEEADRPEADEEDLPIRLVRPLLGFPGAREFVLRQLPERYRPFARLVSLDQPGLEFLVVPPGRAFPDYVLEVPREDAEALGVERPEEVRVLALVTRGHGRPSTANLMGPLLVSALDGRALQLVLQDGRYGVAVPLEAGRAGGSSAG